MTRSFIEVPIFSKQWKELGYTDEDLFVLHELLLDNPTCGAMMKGTGGIRKIRVGHRDRGKSGGARVCYVDFEDFGIIYLITIFPKSEKANLTSYEKRVLRGLVKQLREEARRKSEQTV